MKMLMEYDEKTRIAQEERDEKHRIAQEESDKKRRIAQEESDKKRRIAQEEREEKARIAQIERDENRRIALKEQNEQANAQMMAIIGMLLDGRSIEQKPDQCRRMEPEPEQIRMQLHQLIQKRFLLMLPRRVAFPISQECI